MRFEYAEWLPLRVFERLASLARLRTGVLEETHDVEGPLLLEERHFGEGGESEVVARDWRLFAAEVVIKEAFAVEEACVRVSLSEWGGEERKQLFFKALAALTYPRPSRTPEFSRKEIRAHHYHYH